MARRPDDDLGIREPRRADQLLDDASPRLAKLPFSRRRGDVDRLVHTRHELVEVERPVVERRRQPEPELDQRLLPRAVAAVHAADLRYRDVTLVDHEEAVVGEVIEQRVGRVAGRATVQVSRVVLDPGAEAHLGEQLEVVLRPLLQPLRLEELPLVAQLVQTPLTLGADGHHGPLHHLVGRDVVAGGIDRDPLELSHHLAAQRVDLAERLDRVAEELHPDGLGLLIGREDLHDVAPHAERAAVEIEVVALVLHVHELAEHGVALGLRAALEEHEHVEVARRRAEPVDARHARHHQHVVALEQRLRGRMAHLVDLVVDRRVLLDVRVGRGHVRLGLVVVVVADEVPHGVLREERAELVVELGGERLVRRDDEGRLVHVRDDVRHRERLAAARDAEQHLV